MGVDDGVRILTMAIILRPKHIAGLWGNKAPMGVRTLELLKARQASYLAPNAAACEPMEIDAPILAYVGNGAWRINCRCNEATHADPDWMAACCFGCGAIYTNVVFPEMWHAIEELLAKRPVQGHRNWQEPETYESLVAEQIAHGDPV